MVHLIDLILVGLIVGIAVFAFARFLIGLGRTKDHGSVSCSGCASCNDSSTSLIK